MNIVQELQGSPEWLALRTKYLTASEAPCIIGISKYKTRTQLLREKSTGIVQDVDAATQARFDAGHAAEAVARGIVESLLGAELFQVTATLEINGLPLLASLDGVDMGETIIWESKLANGSNADLQKVIDEQHWPQLEVQMLVAGIPRVYFTTSDGTEVGTHGVYYESQPARRKQVLGALKQFYDDLAEYVHVPAAPEAVADHIDSLPALTVQIEGRVLTTNLDQFKQTALEFIGKINTNLKTDDDFATAEKTAKFCKDAEERLDLVKSAALAQTASIDDLFRTIDSLREELRAKRLTLEKAVKSKKDDIRVEIQSEAKAALAAHVGKLNQMIGKPYLPVIAADFAGVMKGKKTVASLRDAADTELARCKIEAGDVAQRIMTNLNSLRELAADHAFLFADTAQIVLKANDDLVALVKLRIAEHKEAEARRAERELSDRLMAEAATARAADAVAVQAGIDVPAAAVAISASGAAVQPSAKGGGAIGAPRGMDETMVNMHITNITRKDAIRIAELLGNGAVVWENGTCYPTSNCVCSIVMAGKENTAERVPGYTAKDVPTLAGSRK